VDGVIEPLGYDALDNPLGRLTLRAKPVNATPPNQLVRQHLPVEVSTVRLNSIKPIQGGVPFESMLARILAAQPLASSVASPY
jgi:hypothetical protein